jgi:CRISPR/Cas system endoribonuclease Cas6 (RAMP superfamily)
MPAKLCLKSRDASAQKLHGADQTIFLRVTHDDFSAFATISPPVLQVDTMITQRDSTWHARSESAFSEHLYVSLTERFDSRGFLGLSIEDTNFWMIARAEGI